MGDAGKIGFENRRLTYARFAFAFTGPLSRFVYPVPNRPLTRTRFAPLSPDRYMRPISQALRLT